MPEPEEILLDGAHRATLFIRRVWRRNASDHQPETIHLADVRRRLELFVRAVLGGAFSVAVAEAPPLPPLFSRLGRRIPRHMVERRTLPSTDGYHLRLPRSLPVQGYGLSRYRLFVAELAARSVRGTPLRLPKDPLLRDLYLIEEAAAVDQSLAADLPGLIPELVAARMAAVASRPEARLLTPLEKVVEARILSVLQASPLNRSCEDRPPPSTPGPEASLERAFSVYDALRAHGGPYRGLPAVEYWGLVTSTSEPAYRPQVAAVPEENDPRPPRISMMPRRPHVRKAAEDEDDDHVSLWMIQLDDPQEHVEDPMGLQRPTDQDAEADPDDLADSLSELPEARLVATPGRPREVLASDDPPLIRTAELAQSQKNGQYEYPEWDYRSGAYHLRGAVVHERMPALGDPAWANAVLARRAVLLHEVRRRFERLRPRRLRLGRQLDGSEVDLSTYVASYADGRAGRPGDDRLYEAIRPARRDVAIALLVDVSASTDAWVTENLRIIDVEKEALLVVCDALDALGDPYAILAFSGEGPQGVCVYPLKHFEERSGSLVARRIAALEPDRYTRMGAAIRAVTATLARKAAQHRLLMVLSDGKPNDADVYDGRYGVEDARQSIIEARLQGLHPFCVTVDRHAPAYMPRIFGPGGYAVLHHPEHLPSVLVDVLRRLVQV